MGGTPGEISKMLAAKHGKKAMDKVGLNEDVKSSIGSAGSKMASAVGDAGSKLLGKMGVEQATERFFKVNVTVDISKQFGEEKVDVRITDFNTDLAALNKL